MEEADEILLISLRQSGWYVVFQLQLFGFQWFYVLSSCLGFGFFFSAVPSHLKRLADLNTESMVAIVTKALSIISEGKIKFSAKLPPSMGAKHRACTRIAQKIKVGTRAATCSPSTAPSQG